VHHLSRKSRRLLSHFSNLTVAFFSSNQKIRRERDTAAKTTWTIAKNTGACILCRQFRSSPFPTHGAKRRQRHAASCRPTQISAESGDNASVNGRPVRVWGQVLHTRPATIRSPGPPFIMMRSSGLSGFTSVTSTRIRPLSLPKPVGKTPGATFQITGRDLRRNRQRTAQVVRLRHPANEQLLFLNENNGVSRKIFDASST